MIQLPNLKDTIVALSTAPGMAAIAVIRMSGVNTMTIANRIFHGKNLESVPSHSIHFGSIRDGKKIIDEVLISIFRAPNSFTKEEVVEISCHGSTFIQDQILKLCIKEGARMAQPGEFSMRAFLNGQMDLSQAEAIADLIAANSKASHDLAMKQMRGGISKQIQSMRSQLVDLASLVELELDFSEEDVEFADRTELRNLVNKIHQHIVSLIQSFELGNAIKNGIPTVIAGRPNAGKSTLLNALLNEDRAIVSDIAGTTRDTIEEVLNIQGVEFRLIDTAGIRAAQDLIESMGVEKTMEKIKDSSLIVYVFDVIETQKEAVQEDIQKLQKENGQLLIVANKMDLNPYIKAEDYYDVNIHADNLITASAINQMNIEYLKEKLFEVALGSSDQQSHIAISNNRHLQSFVKTQESLEEIMQAMDAGLTSDLLAFNIRNALHYLGEVTGEVSTDDLLGNIFGKFCIGK